MRANLSSAEAARIMLTAQGFGIARPRSVTLRQINPMIDRLAQFQIDSVNVLTRAHYAPLFSRLGPYDTSLLDRAAGSSPRRLFEYWGHAACLIDVGLQPALRHKMAAADRHAWEGMRRIRDEQPDLVAQTLTTIAVDGPLTAREVAAVTAAPGIGEKTGWGWNWSATKCALEWLFLSGEITSAGRNAAFERRYDLPERVLPSQISKTPTPEPRGAYRELVGRAAQALGITTVGWAAEYFRIPVAAAQLAVQELSEAGLLVPVSVAGWVKPAWVWHQARLPRRVAGQALICPFDPLLFDRARLNQVLGCDYRIEIYVPAAKRRYGYYVYCFLLGERIAARVDLKADRQAKILRVQSAWAEPGHTRDTAEVVPALAAELATMAQWLGLDAVQVEPVGDLAAALAALGS